MKKIFVLISLILLAGCSSPLDTVKDVIPSANEETQQETMDAKVHLYSLTQNAEGYVIAWDERNKWAIVPASVIVSHPKVLVETSNGQLLEGTVTLIDIEHNEAIVHFRNSAVFKAETDLSNVAKVYVTYDMNGEKVSVDSKLLEQYVENLSKDELSFEQRAEAREALKNYVPIVARSENKVETYDKQTFSFDRDALQILMNEFIKEYNAYVTEQESTLLAMFANDALKEIFVSRDAYGNEFTLNKSNVKGLSYEGYLYKATFDAEMGVDDPVNVSVQIIFSLIENKYKIVTLSINK